MNSLIERIETTKNVLTDVTVDRLLYIQGYIQALRDTLDTDMETE